MHKDISIRAKWVDTVDLEKTVECAMNTRGRKQLYSLKFMHDVHRVFIARFIPPFLPSFPPPPTLPFFPFFPNVVEKNIPRGEEGLSLFFSSSFLFFFFFISFHIFPLEQRFPNGGKLPRNKKVGQKLNYRTFSGRLIYYFSRISADDWGNVSRLGDSTPPVFLADGWTGLSEMVELKNETNWKAVRGDYSPASG